VNNRHSSVRSAGDLASLDAGSADVEPLRAPSDDGAYALDVRVPAPVGLLLGPGDVVAESGPLAAYVTYRSHWSSLPKSGRYRYRCPLWATGKEYPTSPSAGQFVHASRLAMGVLPCVIAHACGGSSGSSPLLFGCAPVCCCARPRGFKWVVPLAIWVCPRVLLRTSAGVQVGRPPCE
jgi:hypothetical protein